MLSFMIHQAPVSQQDIDRVWKHSRVAGLRQKLHGEILRSAEKGWFERQIRLLGHDEIAF